MAALYDTKNCAEPPSVPSRCQLSQKVKTFNRGSFSTGTTGYGFIQVVPPVMIVNDSAAVNFTTATSVGTASTAGGSFTNTSNGGNGNSPFATASYGTTVSTLAWKLVGCTLYLKYSGTELNRGGDLVLVEEPNHKSLNTLSYNTSMNFDFAKRVPMGNDWVHISFTPNALSSSTILNDDTDFNTYNPTTFSNYLGAYVNTAGAPQPLDYEVYCWFEVVGSIARGATSSYEDPIGFSAVVGAAEQFQQLDSILGMDGFVHAVENQLDNMSGVATNATHKQNWAGLAAFLPQLADIATRALSGAATGALKEFGYKKDKSEKKPRVLPPPPPPPPPKLRAALQAQAAKLKKR